MVDRTYLSGKAPPPARWATVAHQTLLPAAIDAAGAAETALERLVIAARQRPLPSLALALCTGFGLALALRRAAP